MERLSEYAAAVGLAALDTWTETRADFARVAAAYRDGFSGQSKVMLQEGFGAGWVSSTVIVAVQDAGAESAGRALAAQRIGTRRWWGGGLHRHGAFAKFPRGKTDQTEELADSVLGLPCWRDLPNEKIGQICDIVLAASR